METPKESMDFSPRFNKKIGNFSEVGNVASLSDSISGREAQGLDVQKTVNYYFTPGAPGQKLFSGLKPADFLTAALQIHPKLTNGTFDKKYIAYCNALGFPVTDNPQNISATPGNDDYKKIDFKKSNNY
jgi:hypothetical protein